MAEEWDGEVRISVDDSGFAHDAGALESVETHLTGAADTLHEGIDHQAISVDAGASTEVVNAAIAKMRGLGVISTNVLREAATRIDAARGSYGEIDNTAEGFVRRREDLLDQMVENADIADERNG